MKNISIKTIIAVITFIVGVTFAIFWFKLPSQIPIVSNIFPESEETEVYEIYSVALNKLFAEDSGELLVISDKTSNNLSIKLKPKFNISINYVFIDEEKYDDKTLLDETNSEQKSNKQDISDFFKAHPKARGLIRLSQVKFNEEKTAADVFIELTNCPLCGFGRTVHLEKNWSSWKIKNISDLWVS